MPYNVVGRRSSDEDDDEDDASCEWFSGFSVGERDRVRRSRTDRPASVYSFVRASTVEDRLGIPRICAHSGRTTCSELAQILYTQRDSKKKYTSSYEYRVAGWSFYYPELRAAGREVAPYTASPIMKVEMYEPFPV